MQLAETFRFRHLDHSGDIFEFNFNPSNFSSLGRIEKQRDSKCISKDFSIPLRFSRNDASNGNTIRKN